MGINPRNGVRTLEIGDILEVRLDAGNRWSDEWMTVEVQKITIYHSPKKNPNELDPYICVGVDDKRLTAFNYSLYCLSGAVRFKD